MKGDMLNVNDLCIVKLFLPGHPPEARLAYVSQVTFNSATVEGCIYQFNRKTGKLYEHRYEPGTSGYLERVQEGKYGARLPPANCWDEPSFQLPEIAYSWCDIDTYDLPENGVNPKYVVFKRRSFILGANFKPVWFWHQTNLSHLKNGIGTKMESEKSLKEFKGFVVGKSYIAKDNYGCQLKKGRLYKCVDIKEHSFFDAYVYFEVEPGSFDSNRNGYAGDLLASLFDARETADFVEKAPLEGLITKANDGIDAIRRLIRFHGDKVEMMRFGYKPRDVKEIYDIDKAKWNFKLKQKELSIDLGEWKATIKGVYVQVGCKSFRTRDLAMCLTALFDGELSMCLTTSSHGISESIELFAGRQGVSVKGYANRVSWESVEALIKALKKVIAE